MLMGMAARSCPVMVGRGDQLGVLREALEAAGRGGYRTVLVGGEAGVGKSRLMAEFTAGASAGRVLTGGCLQLGSDGLPFAPFVAVLRDLVRELGADTVTAMVPGRDGPELARLLPELGEPGGGRESARSRLFEEWLALLGHLAEAGPAVLVVEDAHWADESTRDLLTFLIGQQRAIPGVVIAVTFRSDELHRTHPLRPVLAELGRIEWVQRVDLPRLTRGQTEELAARLQGHEPGPELAARLFERSEGNPLFAEELLHSPDLSRDLPESLRDLLLAAVARLPEPTRDVLRVVSAGPDPNGHGLLAAVTGLGDEELAQALRPAVAANVLLATRDGYSFRHALIKEAVHDDLLPGEGERLHARFAAALEADPSLVAPGRAAIEAAHHWYEARDAARALTSAWPAAEQAGRSAAHAERLALLGRVLALWDQVPDAAERIGTDRTGVLEAAVRTAAPSGDDQRGLTLVNALLKELDPDTEPARVARMLVRRARFKLHLSQAGPADDLQAALDLVPAEVSASARAEVLLALAPYGLTTGQRELAREALDLARQAGDVSSEVNALMTLATGIAAPGYQATSGSEVLTLMAQARTLAARIGDWQSVMRAAVLESHLLAGAGEHEHAAEVANQGVRDAAEHGLGRAMGTFLAINTAQPLIALGRWDEALAVIDRALELSPPIQHRGALRTLEATVTLARGQLDSAAAAVSDARAAVGEAQFQDQYHLPLAGVETGLRLAADGPAVVQAETVAILDRWDLSRAIPQFAWPLLVTLGRVSPDERLRVIAAKMDAFGPVQRAYQLTFTAQEQMVSSAWDEAAGAWEALSQPYETAGALLAAAEAALADGDRETATDRLRRAAPLAELLGAEPLSGDIAALARRARIALGDAPAGAGSDRLGLTDREFEVLRLVAAGRSNREIAAELFISVKTASVHVSNILAKLGVASRGEAAARAHERHLFDRP